jgi:hypothetical protein
MTTGKTGLRKSLVVDKKLFAHSPEADKGYVYLVSLVAAIGGFLFGYDLSIISGAIIFLEKDFSLTSVQLGFCHWECYPGLHFRSPLGWWNERLDRTKEKFDSG